MKLDNEQAHYLLTQIHLHASYNNRAAVDCLTRYDSHRKGQCYPVINANANAINAMLKANDPFLTEMVSTMILDRMIK
jgi:hypothetical protein